MLGLAAICALTFASAHSALGEPTRIQWTAHPEFCLDVDGHASPTPPKPAKVYRCNGNGNQNFYYGTDSTIRWAEHTDICLETFSEKASDGAYAQFNKCNGAVNQKWSYEGKEIKSQSASKQCLNVKFLSASQGQDIETWECNSPYEQAWTLKPSPAPTPGPAPPPGPAPTSVTCTPECDAQNTQNDYNHDLRVVYDPACAEGGFGCNVKLHKMCRFCSFRNHEYHRSEPCPPCAIPSSDNNSSFAGVAKLSLGVAREQASTRIQWTAHPDFCLDVDGHVSPIPPKPAKVYRCNGNGNQNFFYGSDSTIRWAEHTDICLETFSDKASNGAYAQFNWCSGAVNQKWSYAGKEIKSQSASKQCLNVKFLSASQGADIETWECNNPYEQAWTLTPSPAPTPGPTPPTPPPGPAPTSVTCTPECDAQNTQNDYNHDLRVVYDPACANGGFGCNVKLHKMCRFCAFKNHAMHRSEPCPPCAMPPNVSISTPEEKSSVIVV